MKVFNIKTIEIKSSEKIDKNYEEKFLLTNLKSENINFNKKSKIYYSFIENLNLYQVLVFESIPDIFFYKSNFKDELFVSNGYIVVYRNSKLYYYQKTNEIKNINELKSFLEKTLSIESLKLIFKEDITFQKENKHSFVRPIKSNLFKIFLLYLLILCMGFYFYEFEKNEDEVKLSSINDNTLALKKSMTFEYISDDIFSLYEKAQNNSLTITSLNFKNSKFLLALKTKEKQNIYQFLKGLEGSVESMVYDEESKEYLANASFKLYRR